MSGKCDQMSNKQLIKYLHEINEQGANIPIYEEDLRSPHDLCGYVDDWERKQSGQENPDGAESISNDSVAAYRQMISKHLIELLDTPKLTNKQKQQIMSYRLMGAHPRYVLKAAELKEHMQKPNFQLYDSITDEEAAQPYATFFPTANQKRKRMLDEVDFVAKDPVKKIEQKSHGFLTRTNWLRKKSAKQYLTKKGIDIDQVAPAVHRPRKDKSAPVESPTTSTRRKKRSSQ